MNTVTFPFKSIVMLNGSTRLRSWFRHCATSRMAAGCNPDCVTGFHWHSPSGHTTNQPLTETNTRNISWGCKGGRCVLLTTLPPSCAECHKILEPQHPGTLRACPDLYGVALLPVLPSAKLCYNFCINNISIRILYGVLFTDIPAFVVTKWNTHNSSNIMKAGKEKYL